MATSNPCDKLNVKREEDDDDQGEFEQVKGKEKSVPFGIEQKRRKYIQRKKLKKVMMKDLKKYQIK